MKRKNFFAIVIALCMVVSATFTACGGSSIEVGEIIQFGGYDWLVLEIKDDKALILIENIIGQRAYHSEYANVTWADSSTREYLNGEFYSTFSEDDKARISETSVVYDDNPDYDTSGGNNTNDKIFLLSEDEVKQYLPTSSARKANYESEASEWWLRSYGGGSGGVLFIDSGGAFSHRFWTDDHDEVSGVRPALWLNL